MTPPDKLIIFDYSGTLSLEAPLFGRPENLARALAESGLATFGIATPEVFWEKIVNPTWAEGSTTGIGYKQLLTGQIDALGIAKDVARTEIEGAASRFVDDYMSHSRIDPRWKGTLSRLGEEASVQTVVATDHYAEATAIITGDLRSLASRIFVANSADIGCRKGDRRFWERLKERLPLEGIRRVLLIDDFGRNEAPGDNYGEESEVTARQAKTLAMLCSLFPGEVEGFPFFLPPSPLEWEAAAARLIAETADRIDAFLKDEPPAGRECKPRIDYPCHWGYKVIGRDSEKLYSAIAEIMAERLYAVTPSHTSKGGAFLCINVETMVESEPARLDLYNRFRCHPSIVMVL